jgi:CRISPR/Cas system CSM-associated protein Csm3 (group 7 of RAMP superfamily)
MFLIKGTIKTVSSFTIGTDGYFIDVQFNELGLAPSALKGAMRTAISWAIRNGMVRGTSCDEIEPSRIAKVHQGKPCDVCSLFGYPDHEGKLRVSSGPNKDGKMKPKTHVITHVSINDEKGTAKENALFKQEVVPPGEEFPFTVQVVGGEEELCLTLASLHYLRFLRLGRGGMVDVNVDKVIKDGKEIDAQKIPLELKWVW